MDWLGKYLQMMQVRPGRRRGEPVVGSSWDIFTMDAGSVWETEGGSRSMHWHGEYLQILQVRL